MAIHIILFHILTLMFFLIFPSAIYYNPQTIFSLMTKVSDLIYDGT